MVIHVWCAVGRSWVARIRDVVLAAVLLELLNATSRSLVLTWNLSAGLVADRRKLNRATLGITGRRTIRSLAISRDGSSASTILVGLALVLLFLLASLPLLSDLLEFYKKQCVSVCWCYTRNPEALDDPC